MNGFGVGLRFIWSCEDGVWRAEWSWYVGEPRFVWPALRFKLSRQRHRVLPVASSNPLTAIYQPREDKRVDISRHRKNCIRHHILRHILRLDCCIYLLLQREAPPDHDISSIAMCLIKACKSSGCEAPIRQEILMTALVGFFVRWKFVTTPPPFWR